MPIGLVGKKCGMSRIFTEDGYSIPVTVIEVSLNRIAQIKTEQSDGYSAVQLTTGVKRKSRISKSRAGHFAKAKIETGRGLWEFKVTPVELEQYNLGDEISVSLFKAGQHVDVVGTTIGRGFAGCIKRHHFSSQRASHGNSLSHRAPGSIGQNQTPGKVFKGKKMAGHLGNVRRTAQNLEIIKVDEDKQALLVKGAVPGSKGSDVFIRLSLKSANADAA